ncbi:hypothetical protein HYC85_024928 [Camellia sinensis]|uniref:Ammonium transporter AmtB-like domain-containing protein n=1 Tax=Camellia sinensis TaxID=4442 RepID=A0A7J7G9H9_CAMSI|nr:hypothetical protein HYC85_024928 [Camellia sinensis]
MELPPNLKTDDASPYWMNKGDNAWQLTAATLVGLQSVPGLVILYGSIVKKKWAVNSAFMAFYAFAAGPRLLGRVGVPNVVRTQIHSFPGQTERGIGPEVPAETDLFGDVSERHDGVFSVCFRGDYADFNRGGFVREDEFLRVDDVCADLDDVFVYGRSV